MSMPSVSSAKARDSNLEMKAPLFTFLSGPHVLPLVWQRCFLSYFYLFSAVQNGFSLLPIFPLTTITTVIRNHPKMCLQKIRKKQFDLKIVKYTKVFSKNATWVSTYWYLQNSFLGFAWFYHKWSYAKPFMMFSFMYFFFWGCTMLWRSAQYGLEISHHLERKPKHHMVKLRHLFGTQPNECYYVCTHILSTITTMARYTMDYKRKPKVFIQVSGCFCVLQLPTSRCWQSKNMSHFPIKIEVY